MCRTKNRLKSELLFQDITIPPQFDNAHWSHNFLHWIEQQANYDEDIRDTLLLMLEEAKLLRLLLLKTEQKLREMMRSEDFKEKSELLRSVHGIGPLSTMLFLLEVDDVRRFKSFDALNRFVGFCPDSHSSGERDRHSGISQRKQNQLRSHLGEAAWQLIQRDAAMLDYYKGLARRMKSQDAFIRVARKLLRRIRAVMFSGWRYACGNSGNLQAIDGSAPLLPTKKRGYPTSVVTILANGISA